MGVMNKPPQGRLTKRAIRPPKTVTAYSGSRTSKSSKPKDNKNNASKVRGVEVAIRMAAAAGQIVYGDFKAGGVYTFLDVSQLSNAFVRIGTGDSQIGLGAKSAGTAGNDISIALTVSGTFGSNQVTVTGSAISVRVRSSGGTILATANEVISAINANGAASALVTASKAEGRGTGVVSAQTDTFLQYGGGSWLHHVITLAAHQITAVDKLLLDDKEVTFGASPDSRWSTGIWRERPSNPNSQPLVFMTVMSGADDQAACPDLMAQLPSRWSSAHRQRGCAHVYIITVWNEKRFAQGMPAISFQLRGKPVYDPRTTLTSFSTNAALIIADYLTNSKFGLAVSWSDIDTTALIDAANICDEIVTLNSGVTERRYQIKGVFDSSESPDSILSEMADAIAGDIVYQSGKWRIIPGKWRAPSVSLSRDDTRGQVVVSTRRSRRDTFNCVRGTISSETHGNELIDYPTIKVASYISEDGKEIYKDLPLNFVTSNTQAQRIARIRLAQIRQAIVVDVTFSIKGLSLQIGDVVSYTDSVYGWTNKAFEVRDFSLEVVADDGILCKVTLAETAEAIYTWTLADQLAIDPAPNTNFPSFSDISGVSNLSLESGSAHLYIRNDGTVFARIKVEWTGSTNIYVTQGGSYEIQYKPSNITTWIPHSIQSSELTNAYILDVKDGTPYDVQVRALTAAGVGSEWVSVTNHIVEGKRAPPSKVSNFAATIDGFGILLGWDGIPDLDFSEYEFRYGTAGATWESIAETAIRTKSTRYFFKSFLVGSPEFQIKAIDTSGNFSIDAAKTVLSVVAPGDVQNYSVSQIDNNVLVDWTEPSLGTFPVDFYKVYKGATFAGATLLGQVGGTFYTYIEQESGTYTYWATAVDIAGNEGTPVGQTILVSSPPDYVLIDTRNLLPSGATLVNCLSEDASSFLAPVNTTETWTDHFVNNSKTTIQGFIDAGFTIWLQPVPTSTAATATWTYDLGVVLPQNLIKVSHLKTTIAGSVTVGTRISWRKLATDPWTDGPADDAQVFATNFQYVKIVLTMTPSTNAGLVSVSNVVSKIDTKKQSDSGAGTVTNATSGLSVNFNMDFIDVISIVVTPQAVFTGSPPTPESRIAVVDFNDAPNPTSFTVYLFDSNGTKVTGSFRWTAEGVVRTQ